MICKRLAILGVRSSNKFRFLAFQIFQMRKRGRYWWVPPFETQFMRFSKRVGANHSRWTSNKILRSRINFFTKGQPTKRCSIVSAAPLHKHHLLGPCQPFLHIVSQVLIFILQVSQIKYFSFWGIYRCQIFKRKSLAMIVWCSKKIRSYALLVVPIPNCLSYI